MVRILGLRLPTGYAADRHRGHITVSLRRRQIGCLAHDIAPLELEAQINSHHGAGGLGDMLKISTAVASGVRRMTDALP